MHDRELKRPQFGEISIIDGEEKEKKKEKDFIIRGKKRKKNTTKLLRKNTQVLFFPTPTNGTILTVSMTEKLSKKKQFSLFYFCTFSVFPPL